MEFGLLIAAVGGSKEIDPGFSRGKNAEHDGVRVADDRVLSPADAGSDT